MTFKNGHTPPTKGKSALVDWLRVHVEYEGEGCLIWPFSRNEKGYGQVTYEGRIQKAHRVMCILAKGPPPETRYNAAHSCHKGHTGCVHPKHLDWKTPSENTREGFEQRGGTANVKRRLTIDEVEVIRTSNKTHAQLSAEFGVAVNTIGKICRGEIWKNPRSTLTRDQLLRIKSMDEAGVSAAEIARQTGIGYMQVRRLVLDGSYRGLS